MNGRASSRPKTLPLATPKHCPSGGIRNPKKKPQAGPAERPSPRLASSCAGSPPAQDSPGALAKSSPGPPPSPAYLNRISRGGPRTLPKTVESLPPRSLRWQGLPFCLRSPVPATDASSGLCYSFSLSWSGSQWVGT